MVNWLKVAGIILIILGFVIIFGSPLVVYSGGDPENHPWETDPTIFYVQIGLGFVLILAGAFLYHLGRKKEKKGARTSPQKSP